MFVPCFVVQCFVPCLVFAIILRRKRELVALLCLPDVLWLLVFGGSSSRCCGLVCSEWLWYFLIILTCFFISLAHKIQNFTLNSLALLNLNFTIPAGN